MSGLSEQQLAEIRARDEAATEGPWHTDGRYASNLRDGMGRPVGELACDEAGDTEFVVHARQDVPALLAEVKRRGEQIADLETERGKLIRWHEEDARQIRTWGRRVAEATQRLAELERQPAVACAQCEGPVGWVYCPTGGWWAHRVHPADGHDAQPIPAAALTEDGAR